MMKKIKILLLIVISFFVINITNANATTVLTSQVSDDDQSTICEYDGFSIDMFNNISGIPLLAPIPVMYQEGSVIIKASNTSNMFTVSIKFRYFDKTRLITVIDVDDAVQIATDIAGGKMTFQKLLDYAGGWATNSDFKNLTGYIQGGSTTVSNNPNVKNNTINAITGNNSSAQYSSINDYGDLASKGKCPNQIKVDIKHNGTIDEVFTIEDISFEHSYHTSKREYFELLYKQLNPVKINNKTIVGGILTKERFSDNAKYAKYDAGTCLSEADAKYYTKQFNIISNYSKNSEYVTMYKNNGFSAIANNIVVKYSPESDCIKKNPGLKSTYESLRKAANDALNVMNNTKDGLAKNDCQYILGDPSKEGSLAYYLDTTFRFIKFAAPLLLIGLSVFDYVKVIASDDADAMKKTNKKTVTRVIFAMLLFVLPFIISYLLTLLGVQGKCDFPNIPGI